MPREKAVVRVPEFPGTRNRDKGKIFKITEWDSDRAERWLDRAVLAINKGGGELPLDLAGIGWEGLAIIGFNAFLRGNPDSDAMLKLQDELLECVEIIRDERFPDVASKLITSDLEEVATRKWLRGEVLSLHLGFSVGAALYALYKKIMAPKPSPEPQPQPTSHPESPPSSEAASRRSRSSKLSTA